MARAPLGTWLAVTLLLGAGCVTPDPSDPTSTGRPVQPVDPKQPVLTGTESFVHRADGETAVPLHGLPASFGAGVQTMTQATEEGGPEPSIGITSNGWVFATAHGKVKRSTNGGLSWDTVRDVKGQEFDPWLWVDPVTDRIFVTHFAKQETCTHIATSDDHGATWVVGGLSCPPANAGRIDHQKLATGPFAGAQRQAAETGKYPQLVTLCYNYRGQATYCAESYDGGATFAVEGPVAGLATPAGPVPLPSQIRQAVGDCGGQSGAQRHAPDGTIYVPYGIRCTQSRIAVSTDGGATWTRHAPGPDQLELDPAMAVTTDGMAYYVFRGSDQKVHMLRSGDAFRTNDGPFVVSAPGITGTVFTAAAAGSKGRLAVAYLGTNTSAAGPDAVPGDTEWNLYLAISLDADSPQPTFATFKVNPAHDPVQRGTIYTTTVKDSNDNLGDFMSLQLGPDGRPWIAYTDGCTTRACKVSPPSGAGRSRDEAMSVAWMHAGPSLFEDQGRLGPPSPGGPAAGAVR